MAMVSPHSYLIPTPYFDLKMAFGPSLVFAVWAGVSAQLYVSPIQEVSTIKLLKAYFAVNALALAFLIRTTSEEHFLHAVIDATVKLVALDSVFLATCTIVTFFRRLFLSSLSHIPGSTFARLSSSKWHAYCTIHS